MQVTLLGTPGVSTSSGAVAGHALGGRRARVALAALALEGTTIPSERLATLIWEQDLPATWHVALRGIVRGLRAALEPIGCGGQSVIVTDPPGYRLAEGVEVDVARAERLVGEATDLLEQSRYRPALDLAETVARLSGRQILPGEDAHWLRPYRDSVDAIAHLAAQVVVRAAESLGEHAVAIAAARRVVVAEPLEEHGHRLLMQALIRSGDRAGAVHAFERCRAMLAEGLGIDPGVETTEIYLSALGAPSTKPQARLPEPSSTFVGREEAVALLGAALDEAGLVSLTGPGGVGKTRLAAHVVADRADFPGGRLWVPLGAVTEDDLVADVVALLLGIAPGTGDATNTIAAHVAALGRTLLVLDACEVVPDGAASLVAALLERCRTLTVVTTGRAPLELYEERVITLDPLPSPTSDEPSEMWSTPSFRMLADRVRDAGGELTLDEDLAPHLRALLERCGGLPLAIELAAAQLAVMPVGDLLDQLDQGSGERHDLVSAMARGSLVLLDAEEAAVFRRFSVLDGAVGSELARSVVSGGSVQPIRVIRILRELTARGLLTVDRSGPRWHYSQDDDLRRLARELLVEHGEEQRAYEGLADAIRGILPDDAREPPAAFQDAVTDLLGSIRSLFAAGLSGLASADRCLEIAFRLHRYWAATSVAEGRFWLSRLLARCPEDAWTPYATYALGYLDYWSGDTEHAVPELQRVVELFDGVEDPYAARALIYLAGLLDDLDRGAEAVEYVRRAIVAAGPFGTDLQVAASMGLGSVLSERGDPEAATYAVEAIALCHVGGSVEQLAAALPTAAMVCWQVGALDEARAFVDEAQPLHTGSMRIARVVLLSVSAGLALAEGNVEAAIDVGSTADREGTELGVEREMPLIRAVLARALLAAGDLAGATERALSALDAASDMSISFPIAVGLETAALVLDAAGAAGDLDLIRLLSTAASIRRQGNRPAPATLSGAVDALGDRLSVRARGLKPSRAVHLARDLLLAVGTTDDVARGSHPVVAS